MDTDAQFLATGAGCANNTDVAATHGVTKAERRAVDNRRAAVWPHHQQPFFVGQLFERQFIFNRDVIGKQHHVEIVLQRLTRFASGKQTVDRNHRQVTFRDMLFGAGNSGVTRLVRAALRFGVEQFFNLHQQLLVVRTRFTIDDNHQVAVFRLLQLRRQQS